MVEILQVVNKFAETQKLVTIDALLSEMLKIGAHLFQLFLTLNPGRKFAHVNLKGDIYTITITMLCWIGLTSFGLNSQSCLQKIILYRLDQSVKKLSVASFLSDSLKTRLLHISLLFQFKKYNKSLIFMDFMQFPLNRCF